MSVEEKRAFLLLLIIIFNYHGLSDSEQQILQDTAASIDAKNELDWVKEFVKPSIDESYEKSKKLVNDVFGSSPNDKKLHHLSKVWDANEKKGHISEMEATAMLMLSKEWGIQREFVTYIRKKKENT